MKTLRNLTGGGGGYLANRNPHNLRNTRKSGKSACTGYPPASSCKSDKNGSGAPAKSSTRQESVRQSLAGQELPSGDSSAEDQNSTSFAPHNASKKIPL